MKLTPRVLLQLFASIRQRNDEIERRATDPTTRMWTGEITELLDRHHEEIVAMALDRAAKDPVKNPYGNVQEPIQTRLRRAVAMSQHALMRIDPEIAYLIDGLPALLEEAATTIDEAI